MIDSSLCRWLKCEQRRIYNVTMRAAKVPALTWARLTTINRRTNIQTVWTLVWGRAQVTCRSYLKVPAFGLLSVHAAVSAGNLHLSTTASGIISYILFRSWISALSQVRLSWTFFKIIIFLLLNLCALCILGEFLNDKNDLFYQFKSRLIYTETIFAML